MHWTKYIASCAISLSIGALALTAVGQGTPPHPTPQPTSITQPAAHEWWKNAVIY